MQPSILRWAAGMLAQQPVLGASVVGLFGLKIYESWKIFVGRLAFEHQAPDVFANAGAVAAFAGNVSVTVAAAGASGRASHRQQLDACGSARRADISDVRKAGLLGDSGIVLGLYGSRLRHDGPEPVFAVAPTYSGKGIGMAVATLLTWTGSAIVHDIKGDNWALTAGWRSKFSHCLSFDPTNPHSARFNPLLEVRKGLEEVRDVRNLADILSTPSAHGSEGTIGTRRATPPGSNDDRERRASFAIAHARIRVARDRGGRARHIT